MAEENREDRRLRPEENSARLLLKRHKLTPPIDIQALAELYADVEEDDPPVSGDAVVVYNPRGRRRPLIILNRNRPNLARKRFTLAHELGHIKIAWHCGLTTSCLTGDANLVGSSEYVERELEANRFASELLMPADWVVEHIQQYDGIRAKFVGLKEAADVSFEATRRKLIHCLPSGYVCVTTGESSSGFKVECSSGTRLDLFLNAGDRANFSSLKQSLEKHCTDNCIIETYNPIYWWRVESKKDAPGIEDWRMSPTILRSILVELFVDMEVVKKLEQSINGKVSSAIQDGRDKGRDELYGMLSLRFEKRDISTDSRLALVIDHPDFKQFLINKADEIASGRNRKRSSKS